MNKKPLERQAQIEHEAIDAEPVDQELEAVRDTELVTTGQTALAPAPHHIIELAKDFGEIMEAYESIRGHLIRRAKPGDWKLFPGPDGTQVARLTGPGAFRIMGPAGISLPNRVTELVKGEDEKGSWYRWECEGDAVLRGHFIGRVYGTCGSRDKFFGLKDGEWRPFHEINEGHVKKAAIHDCFKEAVRVCLGLHSMDPEDLARYGITLSGKAVHDFKPRAAQAEEAQAGEGAIKSITYLENKAKGWTKYSITLDNGQEYSTFDKAIADKAKKAQTEKKSVRLTYTINGYGRKVTALEVR